MNMLMVLAKECENKTLTKKQAVEKFGTEGQKSHFKKNGRFKDKRREQPLLRTLNQLFESVSYEKNGNRMDYKLGIARHKIAERETNYQNNGKFNKEETARNRSHFLSNQHLYNKHDDEEWLPVNDPEFSSFYYVSNYGSIFSVRNNRILKNFVNPEGYLLTTLSGKNVKGKGLLNHRLVALAFIENPDPENLIIVNHIDGNKSNPHYKNLEWVTPKENSWHAMRTGLRRYGETREKHYNPKPLTVEVVNEREAIKKVDYRKSHLPVSLLSNLQKKEMDTNHFRSVV